MTNPAANVVSFIKKTVAFLISMCMTAGASRFFDHLRRKLRSTDFTKFHVISHHFRFPPSKVVPMVGTVLRTRTTRALTFPSRRAQPILIPVKIKQSCSRQVLRRDGSAEILMQCDKQHQFFCGNGVCRVWKLHKHISFLRQSSNSVYWMVGKRKTNYDLIWPPVCHHFAA